MSEERIEDIGSLLKDRREELGLSLQDAAERTRIRKSYLQSLEESRFSDLPGQAYVTGFIRVYSRYLGLDSAPLLEKLERVLPEEGLETARTSAPLLKAHISASKKKKSKNNGGLFVAGLVVVLIIGAILYLFWHQRQKTPTPSTERMTQVQEVTTEKKKTATTVEQAAEEGPAAPLEAETDEPPVETQAEQQAVSEVTEEPTLVPKKLPPIKGKGSSLRMLALSKGLLVIHVDNRKPQEYTLHDGLDLTWKIREKVSFQLEGPQQARFWLDDKEIVLGDLQSVELVQEP